LACELAIDRFDALDGETLIFVVAGFRRRRVDGCGARYKRVVLLGKRSLPGDSMPVFRQLFSIGSMVL
jgi:hypothetical protein